MLKRLQAAVEESVPGGGVRVYAEGGRYVLRGGPPKYRELDSRPCKLVLEWRNPESTMAHVARGVLGRRSVLIDIDERNVKLLEERMIQGVLM